MQAINTSGIQHYDQLANDSGVKAAATLQFATATKVLTITDASVITAPEAFVAMKVDVYDQQGNSKSAIINAAGGNAAIDLDAAVSLDMTGPVRIKVSLVTTNFEKEGSYYNMPVNADIAAGTAIPFEA